jgi:hypothetical protein
MNGTYVIEKTWKKNPLKGYRPIGAHIEDAILLIPELTIELV